MAHEVHGTFVSEKVNKIRWRPDPFNNSNSFVTGSWDNIENYVRLWGFQENENDPGISPYIISNYKLGGDVTEIKFINPDYFLASSSEGTVHLFKVVHDIKDAINIESIIEWSNIHRFDNEEKCPCTTFAAYGEDIVTVGEDGRINMLTSQRQDVVRSIDNADSCSLSCITFLKYNEILTGNIRGQMKIWDLRTNNNVPSSTFTLSGDDVSATCIAHHPTQRHMVVAGDEEGSLTVWDLRQNTFPVNSLSAHSDVVSEIMFHSDYPDVLCSCSLSGELWLWKTNQQKQNSVLLNNMDEMELNPWYSSDAAKNKLEIIWLMPRICLPVNSIDLNRNRALCGGDNEAIYLINEVNMF